MPARSQDAPASRLDADAASTELAPAGDPGSPVRRVLILGATGSVGAQTLQVVDELNTLNAAGRWPWGVKVAGLAAGRRAGDLCELARRHRAPVIALADIEGECRSDALVLFGPDAAERLVRETECDLVVTAMVGAAGIPATLAAVELGRDVALANKEALVAAGELIVNTAVRTGAKLRPVDSEHAALWQALASAGPGRSLPPMEAPASVRRAVLTASGGPFRERSRAEIEHATREQALRHPTWSMGEKITIDSATLINKASELIEARWLFGLGDDRLGVLIHPQSAVHAMVELADGSVIAQLGPQDMRVPIRVALAAPDIAAAPASSDRLDLARLGSLDFEAPDPARWPALETSMEVIRAGGSAGAVFNAANEEAVRAFLAGRLPFGRIDTLARETLDRVGVGEAGSLEAVLAADAEARRDARERVASLSG